MKLARERWVQPPTLHRTPVPNCVHGPTVCTPAISLNRPQRPDNTPRTSGKIRLPRQRVRSDAATPLCRNDPMVHVSFLEPSVHEGCARRQDQDNRTELQTKKHRRGTQDLSTTKALHTRFKASHAIFPFAECGPRFFHTWKCREERGLTVSFASTLSPCPVWSAHCMRVIATGWALPNRLAHTAGSFLIRSCREFSHSGRANPIPRTTTAPSRCTGL